MSKMKTTKWIFILFTALLTACGGDDELATSSKMPVPTVEVVELKTSEVPRIVKLPGSIIPSEEIQVFSEISGRVRSIHFKEGQLVSKGALLFQIDTDILKAQKRQIQVDLTLAQKDEKRKKNLLTAKGISEEEYEKSASQLASLEAQAELLQVQISKGEIRAPFSGKIGLRTISEGAFVSPTTLLSTLIQVDPIKVEFAISERYASNVKNGQAITFNLEGGSKLYTGIVYASEPAVNQGTRMLTVRAQLKNDGNLIPGTFVSIAYDLGKESDAFMVPSAAIVPVLKGQNVFVARNGKVVEVPIELGLRTADEVQIFGDVQTGDQLIVTGLLAVRNGAPVKTKKAKL